MAVFNELDSNRSIFEQFDLEVAEEFNFTKMCFNESLRIEAPVPLSSTNCFSQDVKMSNDVVVKKGHCFQISIGNIHSDPKEWHKPDQFIPDRFDSNSEYFKRPDGKQRHPLSFSPFTSGRRICIGKTFAEILARHTIPLIYYHYDF